MSELPALLLSSLSPATRKQAEQNLHILATQPGFLALLLRLILDPSQDRAVRLAGSVFFKNVVRRKWEEVCLSFPLIMHGGGESRHALTSLPLF